MARLKIVEVNPREEYLAEVIREIRQKHASIHNTDSYLERVYNQIQYKYVWVEGTDKYLPFIFRFNLNDLNHRRGDKIVYWPDGRLSLLKRQDHALLVDAPCLDELTPDNLLEAIRLMVLAETMNM